MTTTVETYIFEALTERLASIDPALDLPIAWPNVNFSAVGPYLRASHLPSPTDQITLGEDGFNRHVGVFQVDVMWIEGDGIASAMKSADAVVAHFQRGTTMINASVFIRIIRPPSVGPAIQDPPMIQIPVSIRYQADALNPA